MLLGFTHFVSRSRKGRFVVGRKTEGKRFRKKLKLLNERLRALRVAGGKAMLEFVQRHLAGHIQYYGVSGNTRYGSLVSCVVITYNANNELWIFMRDR